MSILITKPTTSTRRHLIKLNNKNLAKTAFIKDSQIGLKNNSGRSSKGNIVTKRKGGGTKKKFREINYSKARDSKGIITTLEYDPNRTANIASVYNFLNGEYFYMIAAKNQKVGDIIKNGTIAKQKLGHSLSLHKIPVGSLIYNVDLAKEKKSIIAKSAGCFAVLVEKNLTHAKIKLNSGKRIQVGLNCVATLGTVSNNLHFLTSLAKAGRSRWLNKRPKVRGVAMNPVDHYNGGGEGKKSGRPLKNWKKCTATNKGQIL